MDARTDFNPREEIRNCAYFPRSRLRLTLKAGSKPGAVEAGCEVAPPPRTGSARHFSGGCTGARVHDFNAPPASARVRVCANPRYRPRGAREVHPSTRMLGRRAAPVPPFLIPNRVPHGSTQYPSTNPKRVPLVSTGRRPCLRAPRSCHVAGAARSCLGVPHPPEADQGDAYFLPVTRAVSSGGLFSMAIPYEEPHPLGTPQG